MPRWETYKVGLTRKGRPVYGFVPSADAFTYVDEDSSGRFYLDIPAFYINDTQLLLSDGTTTTPSLAFLSDQSVGLSAGSLVLSVPSGESITIKAEIGAQILVSDNVVSIRNIGDITFDALNGGDVTISNADLDVSGFVRGLDFRLTVDPVDGTKSLNYNVSKDSVDISVKGEPELRIGRDYVEALGGFYTGFGEPIYDLVAGEGITLTELDNPHSFQIDVPAGGGFYGINVGQTSGAMFKGINTLKFDADHFYVNSNPNSDEVDIHLDNVILRDGSVAMTGQFFVADGTAAFPAIAFASSPTSGIHKTSVGFGFAVGGSGLASIDTDSFDLNGGLNVNDNSDVGSTILGNVTFAEAFASNTITLGSIVDSGTHIENNDGTAAAPSYSFRNDNDTGIFRIADNKLGFAAGGEKQVTITRQAVTAQGGFYSAFFGEPTYDFVRNISQSQTNVVNTVTETEIYSFQIPANTLGTNKAINLRMIGDLLSNAATASNYIIRIKLGATTMYQDGSVSYAVNAARAPFDCDLILANQGATNSQVLGGRFSFGAAAGATTGIGDLASTLRVQGTLFGTAAEDSTTPLSLVITVENSQADANVSFRKQYAFLTYVNKV